MIFTHIFTLAESVTLLKTFPTPETDLTYLHYILVLLQIPVQQLPPRECGF